MINVNFSGQEITVKRITKTPPEMKDIKGEDGNTYKVKVPGSVKSIIDFTMTSEKAFTEDQMPEEIKTKFSEYEIAMILAKQKTAIQNVLTKSISASIKNIDLILNYKDFIEDGQDLETLTDKIKQLQSALKKK